MFLLRDGLFTLMFIASLIVLIRFWPSLPIMLKLSMVVLWPVMLKWSYIGEGAYIRVVLPRQKNLTKSKYQKKNMQRQFKEKHTDKEAHEADMLILQ